MRSLIAVSICVFLLACATSMNTNQSRTSTIAILQGVVWTGDPARPWAEAIAIAGDRIIAVGATREINALIGNGTRVIDARGGMAVPGFIDSHIHFLAGGLNLASVQLRDAKTPAEFIARIKAFAATGITRTGAVSCHSGPGSIP